MAIGFTATNVTDRKIRPDKGFAKSSEPAVRKIKFGDGYEQRAVIGINNIAQTFKANFSSRSKTEADDIIAFFDTNAGVTAFDFTLPDTNSTTSVTATVDLGGESPSSTTSYTLDAATTNLDISPGATVTGSGVSGTVKVSSISGVSLTLDTAQTIADNVTLTFTNPNERTIKVICTKWDLMYVSGDYYTISTSFERVYEP